MVINPVVGVYIPIIRISYFSGGMSLSPTKRDLRIFTECWGSEGPFDVILGFSEGASCAAVLLAAIQGVWEARMDGRNGCMQTGKGLDFVFCCCDFMCLENIAWNTGFKMF